MLLAQALLLCVAARSAFAFCVDPGWCMLSHARIEKGVVSARGPILQDMNPSHQPSELAIRLVDRRNMIHPDDAGDPLNFARVVATDGCTDPRPGVYIYKQPYYPENRPHTFGDDVLVMFRLLYSWGLHTVDPTHLHIVLPARWNATAGAFTGFRVHDDLYRVISTNPVTFVDANRTSPCYETLLTGFSDNTMFANRRRFTMPEVLAFRARVLRSVGLATRDLHVGAGRCKIALIQKDVARASHKYSFGNVDELEAALRARSGCSVDVYTWSTLTFSQQVAAMHDKTVAVALPGSDLLNCFFMPPNSAVIVAESFCDLGCIPEGSVAGSIELEGYYAMAPYHRIVLYKGADVGGGGLAWSADWSRLTWSPQHLIEAVANATAALDNNMMLRYHRF